MKEIGQFKALIVYWSKTGNTEKVKEAISKGMRKKGVLPTVKKVDEAEQEDFFNYDLVCVGAPPYEFLPCPPMMDFLKRKLALYRSKGYVKPCAPKLPGKNAIIFCTYSGPHTGIDEATTAGKIMRQFFEHFGFDVKAEWYVIGEFHGSEEFSTKGRLGDIRGRPNGEDLAKIESDTVKLMSLLMSQRNETS
jgi:flavodoxin